MKRPVNNYIPLPHSTAIKIAAILEDAWAVSPSQKAAKALRANGFTSNDLWRFGKTITAKKQPDQWRNNTYNDMKDFEVTGQYVDIRC